MCWTAGADADILVKTAGHLLSVSVLRENQFCGLQERLYLPLLGCTIPVMGKQLKSDVDVGSSLLYKLACMSFQRALNPTPQPITLKLACMSFQKARNPPRPPSCNAVLQKNKIALEETPEALNRAERRIWIWCIILTAIFIFGWPLLALPAGVFSKVCS